MIHQFRRTLDNQKVFDIIFMDPPYRAKEAEKILELLSGKTICREVVPIILKSVSLIRSVVGLVPNPDGADNSILFAGKADDDCKK